MKAVRGSLNRNQCEDNFSRESGISPSSKTADFAVIPSTNMLTEFGFTYKPTKINNRRYLGNKYKLLPFIVAVVEKECKGVNIVADIFAGTGAVSYAFRDKQLITNDIMYSNFICQEAWFGVEEYSREKVISLICEYNDRSQYEDNYMTANFCDTYFSRLDCSKIGFIRQNIEDKYQRKEINSRERAILITSLLYAMDKIANTCGHYDAYRQGAEFEKPLELFVPLPDENLDPNNRNYNEDANDLVQKINADLVYIDPPYNSRQYCDAYHLLENVALWNKPEVFGVAKKMNRSKLKSDYCTKKATQAFEELIGNIEAKYILLSYNNMAEKGNDRSNAKISDQDIMRILSEKGSVKVFSERYRAFAAGKSNIQENEERLFLCTCKQPEAAIIKSPMNYMGGKYKLLPQLMPLFPQKPRVILDLFCGGCDVGINLEAEKVIFNDSNTRLIHLLETLNDNSREDTFAELFRLIDKYQLSRSDLHGYDYYKCDGLVGLASYNKDYFCELRKDFNNITNDGKEYYLMLYLLIVYAFNNQIRFNSKGEYNLPVGKRDFNKKMQGKLSAFIDRLNGIDTEFSNLDFRDIAVDKIAEGTFVYADPPYLVTCASYNEKNGWTENDEKALLVFLDSLDERTLKFALSNVLESGGMENSLLKNWIEKNKARYNVVHLEKSYANSNYHRRGKNIDTREVLIFNYSEDGHGREV